MGTVRLRVGGPVLAIAADNKTFVARDADNKRLVLWDVASGMPLRTLEGEIEGAKAVFSADGKEVVAVGPFGVRAGRAATVSSCTARKGRRSTG